MVAYPAELEVAPLVDQEALAIPEVALPVLALEPLLINGGRQLRMDVRQVGVEREVGVPTHKVLALLHKMPQNRWTQFILQVKQIQY
jgi:hypothetical protein